MKLHYAGALLALLLIPTSDVTAQDSQSKNPSGRPPTIQLDPGKCHYVFGVIVCTLETPLGIVTLNIDPKHFPALQEMIK
jgi:hypothetical protein